MSTGINIASSSALTVGTTPSTGTNTRVFFQAGGVVQQDANFTFDSTLKRLTLKASGGTISDIPFVIQNFGGTGNLGYINGIGDVAFGTATITTGSGGDGQVVAIGAGAQVWSGFNGYPIAIGKNTRAGGGGISIGYGANSGTGQSLNNNIAIGTSATNDNASTNCIAIGTSTTTGSVSNTIAIGSSINFGSYAAGGNIALGNFFNGTAFETNAYAIGSGDSDATRATLNIGNSFSVYFNNTQRSFFVNKNTNIVMKSVSALAPVIDFGAAATNTLTIHNGTAPVTTIANAGQLYVEAGALRYRDGNGTITNAGGTVQSVGSAATVTPVATNKLVKITAQAVGLTLAVPTGTIADGQDLMIRIKDSGSAQTIAWTSGTGGYRAIGITLPTTTTAGKTTYVGLIYNSDDSRWDAIGVTTEV